MATNTDGSAEEQTFSHEDSLPRVPLPSLEDSCHHFLEWCRPLLDDKELAETKRSVEAFLASDSPAHELQTQLVDYDRKQGVHSWLDDFWRTRYLGRRDRIALNANFFFLFQDTGQSQVERATELILNSVAYKLALDEERIPPSMQRGRPQSMEGHRHLFSTTRIPGEVQDTVRTPYTARNPGPSKARHIVVFYRGSPIRLDVVDPYGRPHSAAEIHAALAELKRAAPARGQCLGHLTSKARAEWARSRDRLMHIAPRNANALDTIETALFCVCLEDIRPTDDKEACRELLAGDSGNRWYDAASSLIVFGDGAAGINGEHCYIDGTTVIEFIDDVVTGTALKRMGEPASFGNPPRWELIEATLDEAMEADIAEAGRDFTRYAKDTATEVVSLPDFGADRAKKLGMSPDAFVQMSYQLAQYRAKGFVGATYESISTRKYNHGRTEAMRVVTPEVMKFIAVMHDSHADSSTRAEALRAAADAHVARAKGCQAGQAPEQHLWNLELLNGRCQNDQGKRNLSLYESPGWLRMRDDYLSTSAVPSHHIKYFGFGATSGHCIGVAYLLLPSLLNVHLSTPRAVSEGMFNFANELRGAVSEVANLLATHPQARHS